MKYFCICTACQKEYEVEADPKTSEDWKKIQENVGKTVNVCPECTQKAYNPYGECCMEIPVQSTYNIPKTLTVRMKYGTDILAKETIETKDGKTHNLSLQSMLADRIAASILGPLKEAGYDCPVYDAVTGRRIK